MAQKARNAFSVFCFVMALLLVFIACSEDGPVQIGAQGTAQGELGSFPYWIVKIEGMTCIYYERSGSDAALAGLTCNWAEWRTP